MTKKILQVLIFVLIISSLIFLRLHHTINPKNHLIISSSWTTYPIVKIWVNHFHAINPEADIHIHLVGSKKSLEDVLEGKADIAATSKPIEKDTFCSIAIANDVVTLIANASHPSIDRFFTQGFTLNDLQKLYAQGQIHKFCDNEPCINLYVRSDPSVTSNAFANFIMTTPQSLHGTKIEGAENLVQAVQEDLLGIGYASLAYTFDPLLQQPKHGLRLIPLDIDESGAIEKHEYIYANLQNFIEAVQSGLYPQELKLTSYFIYPKKPKKLSLAFLHFVLNEGQELLFEKGYIPLSQSQIEEAKSCLKTDTY